MKCLLALCVTLAIVAGGAVESRANTGSVHTDGNVRKLRGTSAHPHLSSSPLGDWAQTVTHPLLEGFMLAPSVFYVPPRYDQDRPSVAFDGTNYFVVWTDERISWSPSDIFGTRVDPSGVVLDPLGVPVCTANGDQVFPSVAFDGANYLVVWEDHRRGADHDIYGARVDVSGAVLDPSGIEICVAGARQALPCITSDGTNSLVVWEDSRAAVATDIWGARVDQDGSVIDPLGFPVTGDTFYQGYSSVAFDGTNYLVVWADGRGPAFDIYGVRLSQSMLPLDSSIAICTAPHSQSRPSIAFGGTDYFIAWRDLGELRMYGTRVDTSGVVLDPSGIVICTTASVIPFYNSSIVFNGQDYLVTWTDLLNGICGARVTTSGIPLDLSGLRISVVNGAESCIASDGVNSLVVWQDGRGGSFLDIYGARVSQSGVILDTSGVLIATAANQQQVPSAVYGSSDYFTVWGDDRNGGQFDVYGARIDPSGTVLDPSGIMICDASGHQVQPSVAFGDPNYLAVWRDGRSGSDWEVCGTRISQSGTVLDSSILIGTAIDHRAYPRVASGKDNYLVVWLDDSSWVCGARVDNSGVVLDTSGIAISTDYIWRVNPAVASDGTDYFVAWAQGRRMDSLDIYGARVTESGTVLDTSGIAISTVIGAQGSPSVAFDGTNYLVVWTDFRFVPYSDIYGARVDTSGVVLNPYPSEILVSTADGDQVTPFVSFDGTNYLVVWEDARSGDGWDIYGARVDTSGAVLDTLGLELIHQPPGRVDPDVLTPGPVVASGPGSQFLMVYDGFLLQPYYSPRVFGAFYPDIGVMESNQRPGTIHTRLFQNRPNPFQSLTAIQFELSAKTHISLRVYDVSGRVVRALVDGNRTAGLHEVIWDGRDDCGRNLATGVYFYRFQACPERSGEAVEGRSRGAGAYTQTRKMVLVR